MYAKEFYKILNAFYGQIPVDRQVSMERLWAQKQRKNKGDFLAKKRLLK